METVSDSDVLQEEEIVDEFQSDILDIPEDNESVLVDTESDTVIDSTVDVSGNDSGTTSLPSGEESIVTLPEAIALDNEQFETLVAMHEESIQHAQISTCAICMLLGVLIGIIFVRGFGKFVRGV